MTGEKRRKRADGHLIAVSPFHGRGIALLLIAAVLITRIRSTSSIPCEKDSQCGENKACVFSSSQVKKGHCGCLKGFIPWKWKCYRSSLSLGEACRISDQCHMISSYCDPLTKTCSCRVGFRERESTCEAANMNSTVNASIVHEFVETNSKRPVIDSYQLNTILYIGFALLCVAVLGILSFIYRKMIQERRQSQAAIKGLLELISENQSLSSFCTNDSDDRDGRRGFEDTHGPYYISSDKIHLPPITNEGTPSFPSPHLSAPVLPPIRKTISENAQTNDRPLHPSIASFPSDFE